MTEEAAEEEGEGRMEQWNEMIKMLQKYGKNGPEKVSR